MSFFNSLSVSAVLAIAALVPAVNAHISMFHPSMYGFNRPDPQTVYPLANQGFNGWWFHGNLDDPPRETMSINPGSTINIELTCGKHYSSWGGGSTWESCPNDQGSYHAGGQGWGGWGQNQDSNLMGCALAIAYKSDAWSVRPEDFIVMSVQENCVKQRDTPFEIPSNLPACPEGGCTCAWFWQGQNSAEEMYMTGFKCDINGGAIGANIPQPRRPRQEGNSDAATQPYYWANYDNQNVDWQVGWNSRPKYNGKMGWRNGAQTNAFANAGGSPGNGNSAPTPSSSPAPAESSSSRRRPRPTGNGNGPEFPNYAAGPLESSSAAAPSPSPTSAPTPENGSETGHTSPSGPEHKPCKKVRRRRRSRVRRAAHHATNAARH